MSEDIFIKNIDQIVEKLLKDLKLKPEFPLEQFKKQRKRYYYTPCQTQDGKTLFLKIIINRLPQENLPSKINKEIDVTNFLEPFIKKNPKLNVPLMVKYNKEEYPQWFLREYFPGPLMGHHFKISKTGLKKEIREGAVANILALQEIEPEMEFSLEKRTHDFYLLELKRIKETLEKKNDKEVNFEEIFRFFEQRKELFSGENFVLAHGDFTLANLFVSKKRVFLNDWEQVYIGNLGSDIALMWLQTFRYPQWRKELLVYFLSHKPTPKREAVQELLRSMIIYRALLQYLSGRTKKEIKKMCQKTIDLALKSFDYLKNI